MAQDRKSKIEGLVEAKDALVESAPKVLTYWVTRDRRGGELIPYVSVWLARPTRTRPVGTHQVDEDITWMALAADGEDALYGTWTLARATIEIKSAVPATDLDCVCVGDQP